MNPFISAFNTVLYQPLFNSLILIYLYLPGHDFGIAVIVLTILLKLVLYPLGVRAIRSQKSLAQLQPKMKEVQEKFKDNKEQQSRAMMELYKKEKINPLSGCLPLIIQLPILIGLYQVFWKGFGEAQLKFLYGFVPNPGQIDTTFLGMMDLSHPSIFLAVLTGIAQFFQSKMMVLQSGSGQAPKKKGTPDFSQMMQKQMLYLFPIFTVVILWRLPAAVALYWLTTTLFTIIQQYIILKKHDFPRI
ncbi:MAG: YidC/Oxa1 family membrane protein insertase [Candidatus Nealsonbacteria bacterium]